MLKFIIGTNEEARRKLLYEEIAKCNSSYLIVPEQFSFESEKLLQEFLGAKNAQKVEVLGFSRLCNSIFRAFGGVAGTYTDETAKLLLMGAALYACGDELSYYPKKSRGTAFIEKLVAADSQLKNAGISPETLLTLGEKGGTLGEKAKDLATVFELFNAMLEKSYIDPLTDIKRATEILGEKDFFGGKAVFLDNFTGFTGSEYKFLSAIFTQTDRVCVSLCCDKIRDTSAGTGLFSKTQRTAGRLETLAKNAGMKVETPVFAALEKDERPEGIIDLEENFLQNTAPTGKNLGEVRFIKAVNPYDEANFAAMMMRELAEKHGYRWRDMAIIARDLTPYEHALPSAFKRAGIPLYMDKAAKLSSHPLSAFISAALEAVRGNFRHEEILRLLKTGIFPVSEEEIAEFENYCFIWNIKGSLFLSPFTGNPEGFRENKEVDTEKLARINALRERVITPLAKLKNRIFGATGREFAQSFYEFFTECEVTDGLLRLYEELSLAGETEEAEKLDSFWNFTVSALDKFSEGLGSVRLEKDEMGRLFELVISNAEIGVLPKSIDCVSAGTADRMRPSDIKAVFVMGLCDGVFPAVLKGGGIFTESEKREMLKMGIDLGEGENDAALSERMYAYTAFTSASERVFATFPKYKINSEEQNPSVLIARLKEAVSVLKEESTSDFREDFWLCNESFAFEHLASFGKSSTPASEALRKYFGERELWENRAQKLGSYMKAEDFTLEKSENAKKLFGENFLFSPTKLDTFESCPFSYFLKSGLVLKDRQKAELSPLSSGNLIHFVLQTLVSKYGGKGLAALSEKEIKAEVDLVLKDYLDSVMDSEKGKTARFMYLYRRTADFLVKLLKNLGEEFEHCEFEPFAFEEPLGGENIKKYRLLTPDGKEITVEGKIDRVDVLKKNGEKYIRVVDYKTGSKKFELCDVYYGINIQMLVYLFSIWQGGKGELKNSVPAGVLYLPAKDSVLSEARDTDREGIAGAQKKMFRMNGLLLDDEAVLRAMEPNLGGFYIPVKESSKGISGDIATLAQFGEIKKHIDKLLCEIAKELSGGKIGAVPYKKGNKSPCDFCSYTGVCRRNEYSPFFEHEKFGDSEFFEKVKGESL